MVKGARTQVSVALSGTAHGVGVGMHETPTLAELQELIAALEAEIARLRPIEAAAREAHAFYAGRRPGFAPSYPRDVLQAIFEADKPRRRGKPRSSRSPSRRKRT
jgi:hypothetical protein